jgi:hypothetical protein
MAHRYISPNEVSVSNCPIYLHVLKWGNLQEVLKEERKHISPKLERKVSGLIHRQLGDWSKFDLDLLACFQPAPSVDDQTKMAIYESFDKYKAERRTIGKPAKMLRKILPYISESDANDFAVWWAETFTIQSDKYTVEESTDEADFIAAYKGNQSKTYDPYLGCGYETFGTKSLQASCMRHDFNNLPVHPAAAYATGDFKIVFARDSNGLIAGRVVVSVAMAGIARPKPLASAIYTTSDTVSALISAYLIAQDCLPESSWTGSRMQRIEYLGGFVLPYVDGKRSLSDCGVYLVFAKGGELEADQTSGLVEGKQMTTCDCCGDSYDCENEGYYVDNVGAICDSCLSNDFVQYEGEYYPNSECVQVYYYTRWGTQSETVPESIAQGGDNTVMTEDGEYWQLDDCVYVDSLEGYYPFKSDDIFMSVIDDEYYSMDDFVLYDEKAMTTDQRDELIAAQATDTDATTTATELELI